MFQETVVTSLRIRAILHKAVSQSSQTIAALLDGQSDLMSFIWGRVVQNGWFPELHFVRSIDTTVRCSKSMLISDYALGINPSSFLNTIMLRNGYTIQ